MIKKYYIFRLNEVLEFCKVYRNKPLIVKPDIGCQGKGIFITKNLNDIKDLDKMICQVYISKVNFYSLNLL